MKIDKILDDKLEKSFSIVIPVEIINTKINETASKKQENYRLDGFRKGKVPVAEIIKRERMPLFYETSDEVINEVINNLIKDNNYKLASQAEVDFENIKLDEDVALKVYFELVPDIEDLNFEKIKLDTYKIKIEDQDIQDSFNKIVENFRKLDKKEGESELNDTVKINFEGFVNGEPFNGGKGEDFNLKLGSKTFIDGFEEQLIGKKAGDNVDVNVRFPDTYHSSELAGKDALFKVYIIDVLSPSDEEINDEFIKTNFAIESVEKMKEVIKAELENNYNTTLLNKAKANLIDKLDEVFDFDVPKKTLSKRIDIIKKYKKDATDEELDKEAKKSLKCGFILSEVGEKNNINIVDSELTEAIMREAMYYRGKEKEIIDMYKNNERMLDSLKNQILEDKIINFILDKVSKNEKEITIKEFENI